MKPFLPSVLFVLSLRTPFLYTRALLFTAQFSLTRKFLLLTSLLRVAFQRFNTNTQKHNNYYNVAKYQYTHSFKRNCASLGSCGRLLLYSVYCDNWFSKENTSPSIIKRLLEIRTKHKTLNGMTGITRQRNIYLYNSKTCYPVSI